MDIRTCDHVRANGTTCGSPALKNDDFCYFHAAQRERRLRIAAAPRWTTPFQLPLLEDANAVQIAIMDVANAFLADRIDHKKASLLLYALQTAASNSHRLSFDDEDAGAFLEYHTHHYYDHDNLQAAAAAAGEEEEETEPTKPELPPAKPNASENKPPRRNSRPAAAVR